LVFVAVVPVFIWLILLFARGGFWRVRENLPPALSPAEACRICAVIPARDEEQSIGDTIASLLAQEWAGSLHVFVVDDNSRDRTAEIARRLGTRVTVLLGRPLPAGWTGKLWALSQGVSAALQRDPDFLLFTDADITHGRHSLSELVAIAQHGNYDLTSFMVKLTCETTAEKALIPAFVFFFFLLYPPQWIRSGKRKTAGAAGGCVLIRPRSLERAGGIRAIRNEVIDDCALARAVKQSGGRLWLGLTDHRWSDRRYNGFGDVGRMIARTAFRQLNHSPLLLLATLAGLSITYVLPLLLVFSGNSALAALGGAAWLMMAVAYAPMVRFYGGSFWWTFTLPAVAVFYAGATCLSAIHYWTGRGGQWKGRSQDAA
jgi:hopene-associated glycosyltransferase HpnB